MKTQFFFDLPSLSSVRRSTFGLLSALLLSLILAGCGGDGGGGSFVAPGTGDGGGGLPAGQTGSVTFHFVQAQANPIVVPLGTERLRFEFHVGANGDGNVVLRETRNYATPITIDGVPTTSRSVVVTAFGSDGFPTVQFTANITVVADDNIVVTSSDGALTNVTLDSITVAPLSLSLSEGDSVRLDVFGVFSSGDRVQLSATHLAEATIVSGDPSIASISDNVVSAAGTGSTVVTITFRGQTVAVPVSSNLGPVAPPVASGLSVDPQTIMMPPGTVSAPVVVTASFSSGPDEVVTADDGLTWSSTNPSFSVNSAQQVVVAANVAPGTSADIQFRYLDQSVTMRVTVSNATLVGLSVEPSSVSIPFGGFEQNLAVQGRYSDNTTFDILPSELTIGTLTRASRTISTDGSILTLTSNNSGTAGTEELSLSYTTGGQTFEEEVPVEVGVRYVRFLEIDPATLTMNPGDSEIVTVNARLDDDSLVDVSEFLVLTATSSDPADVLANGRNIVAVGGTPADTPATVTFSLPNSGQNGNPATGELEVTVNEIELVNVNYFFAGNAFSNSVNTLNLPRGYVGVFEVEGVFSNGTVRRLRSEEYTVSKVSRPGDTNPGAIGLFGGTGPLYQIRQPDSRFLDGQALVPGTEDTVDEVVDDFILGGDGPRTTYSGETSTSSQVAIRPSFRAVAADWYRGNPAVWRARYGPGENQLIDDYDVSGGHPAPGSSASIEISVVGYPEFNRVISVTVTDPEGPPTFASVQFANYPADPNLALFTLREVEVRVDFPQAQVPLSLPPHVGALTNFKLAEANIEFEIDRRVNRENLLHHRATELGFIGVTAHTPVDNGIINMNAQPLGGIAVAPMLERYPEYELSNSSYVGTVTDPAEYTPGIYGHDLAVFGQASGFTPEESTIGISFFDPGPASVAGKSVTDEKATRQPADYLSRLWQAFTNDQTNGFRVVTPKLFSLESVEHGRQPFNLPIGKSAIFRTVVQWADTPNPITGQLVDDVSKDYPPVVVGGLAEENVVFGPYRPDDAEPTGAIIVSGVSTTGDGQATVRAVDVGGAQITAIPAGSAVSEIVITVVNALVP